MSRSNDNQANSERPRSATPAYRVAPIFTQEGILQPIGEQSGRDPIILPRTKPFRIGRDASCELQLFDVRVSRQHAKIEFTAGDYILTDLNSSNGVYVNGTRIIHPVILQHDDLIEFGSFGGVVYRFEFIDLD